MKVNKWDKWQTFRKDRGTPPWIKVHRNLLTNIEWVSLSDAEKGQLVSIWVIAADKNGTIPDDPKVIQRMAMLDKQPNLNKFIELGFLTTTCQPVDNQVVTSCRESDAPEKSRVEKRREDTEKPTGVKDAVWSDFVQHRKEKRSPLKPTTLKLIIKDLNAWKAEGHDPNEILITSIRNGWTGIFKPGDKKKKATNGTSVEYVADDDLNSWAARNGAPPAKQAVGYTYDKYREDLMKWEQAR